MDNGNKKPWDHGCRQMIEMEAFEPLTPEIIAFSATLSGIKV